MVHRDLDEPMTGAFDQRGNEPVHPFKRDQRTDAFALHRFQGAAGIAHAILRETAPNEIRDPARDPFYGGVLALGAIAANEVGAALDLGEEARNIGRIVLQIAVDKNRDGAAGRMQTCIHRRALPRVALELKDEVSQAVMKPVGTEGYDYTYVIMPMRV